MISSKIDIRNRLLDLRAKLNGEEVHKRSGKICNLLQKMGTVIRAKRIGVYLPVNEEVDIKIFMDSVNDKTFYVPKRLNDGIEYRYAKFENWDELESGPYGIMQPLGDKFIDINSLKLIIVPGVAFDKRGVRLGYGAGVYDKLLAKYKGPVLGLAYRFQLVEELPFEAHDVRINTIVTENTVITI